MLEAAAEKAELTSQIRSLLAWVGPGRKLTQTGRIGLADARQLVELLGTGDTIDPEIGGRGFKTRYSEDLAHLNRIVEWAKAARLVRVTGTKLMPVKKNAALAEQPLDLILALLAAYPRLGRPLFPRNTRRQSLVGDEFTDISQELTTAFSASWSSTARPIPPNSPIWAGMRSAVSAAWHSQAVLCSRYGLRSPAWTARRCGGRWWSPLAGPS